MDSLFFVFEIIGTIAFAISGAMVGIKKNMDILGVIILGLTTAVGGGVIRDVVLGNLPPVTFLNPIYAVVAIVTSIIVFLPFVRKHFEHNLTFDVVLLIADSLGLGIFSVVGVQIAYAKSAEYNTFLLLFVGIITGVGGGVLRDVFALSTPHIFVKHFYACASIIGTLICVLLWGVIGEVFSMIIGALIIIVLRFLAAKYRWELPKPNGKSNKMQ